MAVDAKSVTGLVFMYNSGTISWASRRQMITALSTSEAELISFSSAAEKLLGSIKLFLVLAFLLLSLL
jgi:hypothetical protein